MYINSKTLVDFLQVKRPRLRKCTTYEITIAGARFFESKSKLQLLLMFVDTETKDVELVVEDLQVNSQRFYDFVSCLYRADESSVITVDTDDFRNFRGVCNVISDTSPYFQWNDIVLDESALSFSFLLMEEVEELYM